jgi:Tol biopolymer transport system component
LKRALGFLSLAVAVLAIPASGQRRPVLPQIDEPHPYYYRELYLPQLTSGPSSLCWAPDSEELIYSMAGSLWRQKLDSKEAMQLTDSTGYDYQPDCSPDGKSLIYVSYQQDAMELWLLDFGSGKTKRLTSGGAVNLEPRWSPDGNRIVWVSTQYNGRFHIFVADFVDGEMKNRTRLTGETKSSLPRYYYSAYDMEINPLWTRDGKELLFVSNKGHIHGTGGFWKMKAEPGAEAREIHYEETSWKARPDFSPDGSRMVYSSYLGRPWHNLWVMPANGGDAFPISYGSWDQTNPRWSPDGKKIAYISNFTGSTAIEVQEFPSGGIQQITGFDAKNLKFLKPMGTVRVFVEDEKGQATVARVSLTDETGRFCWQGGTVHADDGFDRTERQFERHYVYVNTGDDFVAPAGKLTLEVSKGLGFKPDKRTVEIAAGETKEIRITLRPLQQPWKFAEHWSNADLHAHMNYGGTYQNDPNWLRIIADGEGVQFVNNLTVNKEQRFPDIEFVDFGDNSGDHNGPQIIQGQEFHTSYWGHRGILNLKDHLLLPGYAGYPNTAAVSLFPMNADVYDMAHVQGALVGAVHPFDAVPDPFAKPAQQITDELPVDVALGKLDYIEIVGFSDHKSTAAVWYKLLNLGFKLPAGGGTDATTNYAAPIRGQVGFDRVYVWTRGWPANIDTWLGNLKQGHSFATNGPLIEFKLGGEMVGSELKFDSPQASVPFTAKLRSLVPVDHLEVVCDGKVAQSLTLNDARDSADGSGTIPLSQSGWCVLRAWSENAEYPVMDNYAYATTSPVYVTIAGKRACSKEDADYFKAWIDRTIEITDQYPDWNSAAEKQGVLKKLHDARAVYQDMKTQ